MPPQRCPPTLPCRALLFREKHPLCFQVYLHEGFYYPSGYQVQLSGGASWELLEQGTNAFGGGSWAVLGITASDGALVTVAISPA